MTPPSRSELLLRLFQAAAESQPIPPGPHVVADEELLTCWSLDLLGPHERSAFQDHLALCPQCRRELVEMIRAGTLELADVAEQPARAEAPVVLSLRRPLPVRTWAGWALAAAAAVLVLVSGWLFLPGRGPEAVLAQAANELDRGQAAVALNRVEALLATHLDPPTRDRAAQLLEQAGYVQARTELADRRFQGVEETVRRVADQGVTTGRLQNLKLQAERRIPAEVTLAHAGALVDYGYQLDGSNPGKGALPVIDAATERRQRDLQQASASPDRSAAVLVNHGQLLLELRRYDEARKEFTRALEMDPGNAFAHLGLGLTAYEERDFRGAVNQFEAALKLDPDNGAAHLNAALTLERLERPAEAQRHWDRARALIADPDLRGRIDAHRARPGPEKP
jgi:tetratricopeptide (TPR) repeat protein